MSNWFKSEVLFTRHLPWTGYRMLSLEGEWDELKVGSLTTLRGIDDLWWVDWLVKDVQRLVLNIPAGTTTTQFSVGYIPLGVAATPVGTTPTWIWEIDIANQDAPAVIWKIRDLINQKLGAV